MRRLWLDGAETMSYNFSWEEVLGIYCCSLFDNIFFKANVIDKWTWKFDHGGRYPDKGVYHLMMQVEHNEPMTLKNLIRNKVAPIKCLSLFVEALE